MTYIILYYILTWPLVVKLRLPSPQECYHYDIDLYYIIFSPGL